MTQTATRSGTMSVVRVKAILNNGSVLYRRRRETDDNAAVDIEHKSGFWKTVEVLGVS